MLRLTPDATRLWVQTSGTNENVILDAETLAVLGSTAVGLDPEQVAFQPGGPYALSAHLQSDALFVLDAATSAVVTTIACGATRANICYTPDGALAFVASPSGDDVIVVDMARLTIVDRIPTVPQPFGLVLLDAASL